MKSSIFTIDLSQLDINKIRSFCDQGFPEALRIDYKKDFPKNLEHNFRMTEEILRYLVLRLEKKTIEYKLNKKKEFIKETEAVPQDTETEVELEKE